MSGTIQPRASQSFAQARYEQGAPTTRSLDDRSDRCRVASIQLGGDVPRDLQARVRRLLHDPGAELLFWCGTPVWAYADVDGRRRELANQRDGFAITSIEHEGRPLAAIVHGRAQLDEPELVDDVATMVGLEVERDRSLVELERSERRSRALLDAVPDKMFRIRGDGIILDIQETRGPAAPTPAGVAIGASVNDAAVPRNVTERVMAAGRLALKTGELETIEWQIGEVGNVRHLEGRFMPSGEDEF